MGIFGFLFFGLVVFLFFRSNTKRGQNFVRSYYYLMCLQKGKSVEEANYLARDIITPKSDPGFDKRLMIMAAEFAKEHTNGKQLPIINEAIASGFIK